MSALTKSPARNAMLENMDSRDLMGTVAGMGARRLTACASTSPTRAPAASGGMSPRFTKAL